MQEVSIPIAPITQKPSEKACVIHSLARSSFWKDGWPSRSNGPNYRAVTDFAFKRKFDAQVQGLTKILVDSLNDQELTKHITSPMEPDTKSIAKLELFLRDKSINDCKPQIEYLRNLQNLRSKGVAHLKATGYEEVLAKFGGGPGIGLQTVFRTVLTQAVDFLRFMRASFLSEEGTD